MHENEIYLSVKDLSRRYHIHEKTPYHWIRSRGFPAQVKLGGCSRWRLSDVVAWEEQETTREARG